MKKMVSILCVSQLVLAVSVAQAHSTDKINLEGTYNCAVYDNYDGALEGPVTFTLDKNASDPEHDFSAYTFKSKDFNGYIAAQGNVYGYYFENNNHKDANAATDHGVGIAHITYDQDAKGKFTITAHNAYYQPDYHRQPADGKKAGGHGTSTCVKVN